MGESIQPCHPVTLFSFLVPKYQIFLNFTRMCLVFCGLLIFSSTVLNFLNYFNDEFLWKRLFFRAVGWSFSIFIRAKKNYFCLNSSSYCQHPSNSTRHLLKWYSTISVNESNWNKLLAKFKSLDSNLWWYFSLYQQRHKMIKALSDWLGQWPLIPSEGSVKWDCGVTSW